MPEMRGPPCVRTYFVYGNATETRKSALPNELTSEVTLRYNTQYVETLLEQHSPQPAHFKLTILAAGVFNISEMASPCSAGCHIYFASRPRWEGII